MRMNDAPYLMAEKSLMRDDIHTGEVEAGHVIGEKYGCFGSCYDYTHPRIREAQLGFIGEILAKYDVDGLNWISSGKCSAFITGTTPTAIKL